jgi:crotonobetainyl-CoA:carnitine CoA-transferase CaiB-like acyl-CoA transferase
LIEYPRFRTSSDRVVNRAEMCLALAKAFQRRSCAEWLSLFQDADILCSKVADYADLLDNPQLTHLNMLIDLDHPTDGSFRTPGCPINPREANQAAFVAPARLGEHTRSILEDTGFAPSEIDRLLASGAVASGKVK